MAARVALDALADEAGIERPQIVEGPPFGWRHRARLAVRGRAASPKIGLFQAGSHRIVDIPRCAIHHPAINEVAADVKRAIRATATPPYAEGPHKGVLRYVQVVVERASGRAQVVLVANAETADSCEPLAAELERTLGDGLHSLWWNGNPERGNSILGPHWRHLAGAEHVREEIAGVEICFPPGAFGQANLPLADAMVRRIGEWVGDGAAVADLYAGCGAIGLPLLGRVSRLLLAERGDDSLLGLRRSLDAADPSLRERARVFTGDVGRNRVLLSELDRCDVVIVDPPRKGIDEPVLEALTRSQPARLVVVSCGLPAFLEQARRLTSQAGLALRALEAWALFPHTDHVETLALFEPGPRA